MSSLNPNPRIRIDPGTDRSHLRVQQIPLELCRPNPNQPRKAFDETALQELAASIERHGLLQPITVTRDPRKKGNFVVVAGERRFKAFKLLEREAIPAIVTSGNADEISLIENLQREDLNPFEEAEALARLKEKYGYTHEELGDSVGKARSTISHMLKINELPRRIRRESATSHLVTKSFLIELAKLGDAEKQLAFWQDAKTRGVTVREARARKRGRNTTPSPSAVKQTLSKGLGFIAELEELSKAGESLDAERYEELLKIYQRFLAYLEEEAKRQSQTS